MTKKNTSIQNNQQQNNSDNEKFSQSDNSVDDFISSIPEGHSLFDIGGSRLIEGNRTAAENVISMAADDLSKQSGIPLDKILSFWGMSERQGELFNSERICVFPNEIVKTLEKLSKSRNRGALGQLAKDITTFWKKTVIYSPFRNLIYNIRNFTGDLDALIAGNYNALKQVPRSVKELTDYFLHRNEDGFSATQDFKDYIERSEGTGIPSLSLTRTEAAQLVDIFKSAFPHTRGGIQSLSEKQQATSNLSWDW